MKPPLKAAAFLDALQRHMVLRPHHEKMTVQVVVSAPGTIGGTPTVPIVSFQPGFDWDKGKLLLMPGEPITRLTPEQLAQIDASARQGQSWHAYQAQKRLHERIRELEAQVAALKQGGA